MGALFEEVTGERLIFSFPGIVLASLVYSLPFAVQPLKNAFERLDTRLIETAYVLGLSRTKAFFRVILPNSVGGLMVAIIIAFSCPDGGLLALVGPSGSGKTTICRMVAGLDRPDEGVVICGEETWCDTHAHKWIRVQERCIGFLFQDYTLFPHMSVWENIKFATQDPALSHRLLYLLGIEHLKDRRPCSISGGERQRAALAQALSRRPKVLILDEPFSALDLETRSSLRRLILDIKKRFCLPILFVTHDLYDAYALAD